MYYAEGCRAHVSFSMQPRCDKCPTNGSIDELNELEKNTCATDPYFDDLRVILVS